MRLMECAQLRVKDIDFQRHEITIRPGKGGKERLTMLPLALVRKRPADTPVNVA
jgi:integrase